MGPLFRLFRTPKPRFAQRRWQGGLLPFGNRQPAALAGLGPVAFAAALGRVLLYQGFDVLVAVHRAWMGLLPEGACRRGTRDVR
jgi:hypothetical protein